MNQSMLFSNLNGFYSVPRSNGNLGPYNWKFPNNKHGLMLVTVPTEIDLANFEHLNICVRTLDLLNFKHYRNNGSKFWTSKLGAKFQFAVPLNRIELIPEQKYSYVEVKIDGHDFVFNCSGGTNGDAWTDCVRDGSYLCVEKSIRDLKKLAEASVSPIIATQSGYTIQAESVIDNDEEIKHLWHKHCGINNLVQGCQIYLLPDFSFDGQKLLTFDNRISRTNLTQNLRCLSNNRYPVKVKINQIDWIKTAELNNWLIPEFQNIYRIPMETAKEELQCN